MLEHTDAITRASGDLKAVSDCLASAEVDEVVRVTTNISGEQTWLGLNSRSRV